MPKKTNKMPAARRRILESISVRLLERAWKAKRERCHVVVLQMSESEAQELLEMLSEVTALIQKPGRRPSIEKEQKIEQALCRFLSCVRDEKAERDRRGLTLKGVDKKFLTKVAAQCGVSAAELKKKVAAHRAGVRHINDELALGLSEDSSQKELAARAGRPLDLAEAISTLTRKTRH